MVFFYKKCEVCGNKMSILKIFFKNSTTLECKNCRTKYQAKETVLYRAINFLLIDDLLGAFIILFLSAYTTVYIDSEIYKLDTGLFFVLMVFLWLIFCFIFLFFYFLIISNFIKFEIIEENNKKD
ncbi:hypothetical protein [Campylobacter ureolyticus]|uniref:Uncharacterized protein n=1 Tax=Campylobacter ureolyticus TaxID=827 RepID=A0A9Q4PU92_9BACT|nr:hypothetical protein [Campylobacter ureolyticus]MCZ6134118.1 hypothetical protein [Campylobacter ureolyticus]MCZ6161857.1 hypothetical protein [Campylobacter ureolyticus]MCZ6170554.1 hypothetical protein [Campylobacter ureolyticus]